MKKIIKYTILIIAIVLLFIAYSYFSTTNPKDVKFEALDEFRQYVLTTYEVDEMKIYFSRPSLWIEINSETKLSDKEIANIKEKLKPIINKQNMDIISNKYWAKDSSLSYVHVLFNEKKNDTKTNYLEFVLTQRKRYEDW
ncbi:MAG: hypothetical protein GXY87_06465 [Tissierellia bacterium]|nr:hypothetical protein [Tissierellia bacterium]